MLKGGVSFYCFTPSRELGTTKRVDIGLGFPFYRGFCFIFRVYYCCCVGVLKAVLEWLICKGQFITVCLLESADLLLLEIWWNCIFLETNPTVASQVFTNLRSWTMLFIICTPILIGLLNFDLPLTYYSSVSRISIT